MDLAEDDWRKEIVDYLEDPSRKVSRKLRYKAIKFVLLDDSLFYRSLDGVLLRCLGPGEAKKMMSEVHDGICGAHQSAYRMKWVIRQAGCFWPTMLEDCFEYYKGCQDCQKFGNIQRVPASALNPIIKPWPFRGWGIDLIGQINPPSSKGHKFVLLATDYFTKWVEAIPLKKVTSENMVEFVKEHTIYRFGIPHVKEPSLCPWSSGSLPEAWRSNCLILLPIMPKLMVRQRLLTRSNLYKRRSTRSQKGGIRYSMKLCGLTEWLLMELQKRLLMNWCYELVYGHHAVLPWEMLSDSRRVVLQKDLSSKDYSGLMMDELEDLHMIHLRALENIEKNKLRVAKYYNKKVKVRQFVEGDLVWNALLPIGTKYSAFSKWSPNWEGPFRVVSCVPGNAYMLKTLLGEEFFAAINGRYLKKYYPSIEIDR
jgi:hypothetical protein